MKKDLLLESFVNSGLSAENMKQTKGGVAEYTYKYVSSTCLCFCVVGQHGSTYYNTIGQAITAGSPDSDFVAMA